MTRKAPNSRSRKRHVKNSKQRARNTKGSKKRHSRKTSFMGGITYFAYGRNRHLPSTFRSQSSSSTYKILNYIKDAPLIEKKRFWFFNFRLLLPNIGYVGMMNNMQEYTEQQAFKDLINIYEKNYFGRYNGYDMRHEYDTVEGIKEDIKHAEQTISITSSDDFLNKHSLESLLAIRAQNSVQRRSTRVEWSSPQFGPGTHQ